jgi:propionaldehyde dehydrogenase
MSIDEKMINQIVETVVKKLSENPVVINHNTDSPNTGPLVKDGVFQEMDDAIKAARTAQEELMKISLADRENIIQAIRDVGLAHAQEYAQMEWEETGLGKVVDNKLKIKSSCSVIGIEDLASEVFTGDQGITILERIPYGVIASINPITNGSPTIIFNAIMMLAGANTVINNPHPKTKQVSAKTIRDINQAVVKAGGPPNTVCCLEEPTVPSAQYLMTHPAVKLIAVTGGHGVVKFATGTGKKVIAGGPGNPPVVVDETADLDRAAHCIIEGASFSNCTPCASEKEIFVVASVADKLKELLIKYGAYEISAAQGKDLMKHVFKEIKGPGEPGIINMDLIGKSPEFILKTIGLDVKPDTKIIILETDKTHPLIFTEQIMPVLPLIRCKDSNEAIHLGLQAEQGLGHTIVMHSNDLNNLSQMSAKADVCAFVKNGSSLAGVGVKGEGFISFHVSTDGEGHTRPRTFSRMRRCVIANDFRLRYGG